MILSFCILAAVSTAAPEYPPTVVEVDLSAFFSIKSEVSEGEQEREHDQIYPGVARILHAAGVPIAAPPTENERELLEIAGVRIAEAKPQKPQKPQKLRLEFSSPDFMKSIYRIHVSVRRPDGSYEAIPALRCGPDCLAENVEPFLREHQAAILALLEAPQRVELASSAPLPSSGPVATPPEAMSPTTPVKSRPLGPVGITGAVLGGVGLGGVIWGSVALGLDRAQAWERLPGQEARVARDGKERYFNAGLGVVLTAGASLLVSGIVMIVVDRAALQPRKKKRVSAEMRPGALHFSF